MDGLSGAGRSIGSSILGSGQEDPSVGTGGVAESFFATFSILRSNRLPC